MQREAGALRCLLGGEEVRSGSCRLGEAGPGASMRTTHLVEHGVVQDVHATLQAGGEHEWRQAARRTAESARRPGFPWGGTRTMSCRARRALCQTASLRSGERRGGKRRRHGRGGFLSEPAWRRAGTPGGRAREERALGAPRLAHNMFAKLKIWMNLWVSASRGGGRGRD